MLEKAKKSYLFHHGWKVNCPLINRSSYMKLSDDDFEDEVSITFTEKSKKWRVSGLYMSNAEKNGELKTA